MTLGEEVDAIVGDIDVMLAEVGAGGGGVVEAGVPDPGPVVGGRWTLYSGELPVGAWGATCAITGIPPGPGQRFVDIGFGVDNDTPNGDICLHESYVREIGFAVGLVDPVALEVANEVIEDQAGRIADLEAEVARLSAGGAPDGLVLDVAEIKAGVRDVLAELERRKGGRPKQRPATTTKGSDGDG